MHAPIEFEIGGRRFRARRLVAMEQWHVNRRLAPLIPSLLPIILQIGGSKLAASVGNDTEDNAATGRALAILEDPKVLQPFADGIASMKQEDSEYVIGSCLSSVEKMDVRGNTSTWGPIWLSGRVTDQDMDDMGVLLPIVIRVIKENLGNFIKGLLTSMQAETTA